MNIDFDMITFGYKNRLNGPLRAAVAIAIGVVMVASKANALELAVQIIAALLVASGLVSFIYGYMKRQDGAMSLMSFNAVVDIVLGVLIFLFPSVVANLIIYIVGFSVAAYIMLLIPMGIKKLHGLCTRKKSPPNFSAQAALRNRSSGVQVSSRRARGTVWLSGPAVK